MRAGVVVLFLLLAAPAWAQTHDCDQTFSPVDTRLPFTMGVCWDGLDTDGNKAEAPTELRVLVDGVVVATVANPTPIGSPSATGWSLYTATDVRAPKGARILTAVIVTPDGESLPSDGYSFRVVGAPPAKPVRPHVVTR